jgi:hypothetical protein
MEEILQQALDCVKAAGYPNPIKNDRGTQMASALVIWAGLKAVCAQLQEGAVDVRPVTDAVEKLAQATHGRAR